MLTEYIQEGDVNPFTKQPYSANYKKILKMRKELPVYSKMDELYRMVSVSFPAALTPCYKRVFYKLIA